MITDAPISEHDALKLFSENNTYAGAIVSFSGKVRIDKQKESETQALILESYEPITSREIESKRLESLERWNLDDALIIHRIGKMTPGETIVFVAAAAKHRRAAFQAADFLMDYLKTEAFFWKKEITSDGANWIEPKEIDYQDAQRWTASAQQGHIK